MQEDLEQRTVSVSIQAAKLSGRVLRAAIAAVLQKMEQERTMPKVGRNSMKRLTYKDPGANTIEVSGRIRSFERYARKHQVRYHIEKELGTDPPKWTVYFKANQADALTAAFKEYTKKDLTRSSRPSLLTQLHKFKELAQSLGRDRVLCFQLKSLGKALKEIGLLIMQDAVWNRVTANRSKHKTTWFYIDEFHLLLKGQTGSFSVEIWKRFRKWGGIPSGLTQNVKDLLASREIENIFENSDFIYMLNQAQGDRQILAKQLGISPHQLSYVTHSGPGEGLLFFGNVIIPFVDHFPKDTLLYSVLTTRPDEVAGTKA